MPKVSVIVPVCGVEKYLRECVDSILAQSLQDIEIILVDDGSPDNCPAIVDEYAVRDPRIVAVHQENAGPGPARNKGISLATGDFIAFMDPDDLYPSNETLEHLYSAAISSGCDIAGGKLWLYKDGEDPKSGWELPIHTNFPHYGIVEYRDFQSPYAYTCYLYRRRFIVENRISFPDLRRFQDPPFFVKAMITAGKFVALDEYTYFYRVECRAVDWLGNGAEKLTDHIKGCTEVLRLANRNNLSRLAMITAGDVLGLVKSQKLPFESIPRNIVKQLIAEVGVLCHRKYSRRLRRCFGVGFVGFIERVRRIYKRLMRI